MFLLRDVQTSDLEELRRLAAVLDTVNLPNDPDELESMVELSTRSFAGRIRDPFERSYLFVLEDLRSGQLAGTSQVMAQHGTREAPHIFLDVFEREHYSSMLDRLFRHQVLQIGYNYEGHTEVGGLVVHPEYRGVEKPGKQISFVRFLYVAMHRSRFHDTILAELMPPLQEGGRSLLWEAFGAKFTGISYKEADRLSRESKEFIQQLFPQGEVYTTLLPDEVQAVIGQVGPHTQGVRRMLEQIGFSYDQRIDPFDGGPHFSAKTSEITLVQEYRRARLLPEPLERPWSERLVAVERPGEKQRFRAVRTPCRLEDDRACLPAKAREVLGIEPGDRIHTIPFE